jgi:hypothetical protein
MISWSTLQHERAKPGRHILRMEPGKSRCPIFL